MDAKETYENDEAYEQAFAIFAHAYPYEAYDSDPISFFNYYRKTFDNTLNNEQITKLVNTFRES